MSLKYALHLCKITFLFVSFTYLLNLKVFGGNYTDFAMMIENTDHVDTLYSMIKNEATSEEQQFLDQVSQAINSITSQIDAANVEVSDSNDVIGNTTDQEECDETSPDSLYQDEIDDGKKQLPPGVAQMSINSRKKAILPMAGLATNNRDLENEKIYAPLQKPEIRHGVERIYTEYFNKHPLPAAERLDEQAVVRRKKQVNDSMRQSVLNAHRKSCIGEDRESFVVYPSSSSYSSSVNSDEENVPSDNASEKDDDPSALLVALNKELKKRKQKIEQNTAQSTIENLSAEIRKRYTPPAQDALVIANPDADQHFTQQVEEEHVYEVINNNQPPAQPASHVKNSQQATPTVQPRPGHSRKRAATLHTMVPPPKHPAPPPPVTMTPPSSNASSSAHNKHRYSGSPSTRPKSTRRSIARPTQHAPAPATQALPDPIKKWHEEKLTLNKLAAIVQTGKLEMPETIGQVELNRLQTILLSLLEKIYERLPDEDETDSMAPEVSTN